MCIRDSLRAAQLQQAADAGGKDGKGGLQPDVVGIAALCPQAGQDPAVPAAQEQLRLGSAAVHAGKERFLIGTLNRRGCSILFNRLHSRG